MASSTTASNSSQAGRSTWTRTATASTIPEPYTVTDVNGHYAFYGLPSGQDHVIAETLPAAWLQTLGGPVQLYGVLYDVFAGGNSSAPGPITVYNGAMYFSANGGDGAGRELWRFDGTTLTRVADIRSGS